MEGLCATYMVFQMEMGEGGTLHLQGYVELSKAAKYSWLANNGLGGGHFETARGTAAQNKAYCTKKECRIDGPWEYGQARNRKGQGQRNDIIALRDAIKSGKRGRDLFDDDELVHTAVKYTRGVDRMAEAYDPPVSRDDLHVIFHYGPAGTGKTRCAHDDAAYYFDGNNGFWNGYVISSEVCWGLPRGMFLRSNPIL